MSARRAILMAVTATAVSVGMAASQGVPIFDVLRELRLSTLGGLSSERVGAAKEENIRRDVMTSLHEEQLAALDDAIAAMNSSDFSAGNFEDLNGAPVAAAYNTDAVTGPDNRLFGNGRATIEQMIVETAERYQGHGALSRAGISPTGFRAWFQALVKQESRFQIRVCSHKGACGLTQIMPGTFDYLGIPASQRNDPRVQLDGGARYLLEQLGRFGSMPLALAAYNAGPGAVMEYDGIPPYAETQDYVHKITGYASEYAAALGSVSDLGTLTPSDMALAELGNLSDAGMVLGFGIAGQLEMTARRIRALMEEIPKTASVREAIDLNTYLRGEITRLAGLMTIMEATQRKIEAQRFAAQYQAQLEDEEFLTLTRPGRIGG